MAQNKPAIIIGAGIGRITTAVYLAQRGFRVAVYEKNASPGGRCGQIIRKGHRFGYIEEQIKFDICDLPQIWESIFNQSRGATFGSLAHHILLMGYFRPHNRHRRSQNLYFTGGSPHPGNGIPLILLSAKLTSERILKETYHHESLPEPI